MDIKIYKKIEQNHEEEIRVVNILSFSTSGLYYEDIRNIIILNHMTATNHCMHFGNWEHFLKCEIIGTQYTNIDDPFLGDSHCNHNHKHQQVEFNFLEE